MQYLQEDQSKCPMSPFRTPGWLKFWIGCVVCVVCASVVGWLVVLLFCCCLRMCLCVLVLFILGLVRLFAYIHTPLYPVYFAAFFLVLLRVLFTCFLSWFVVVCDAVRPVEIAWVISLSIDLFWWIIHTDLCVCLVLGFMCVVRPLFRVFCCSFLMLLSDCVHLFSVLICCCACCCTSHRICTSYPTFSCFFGG